MSYWGDRRDDLERAYPSCTSFLTYHPEYREGLIEGIRCGVIFLYASWSGPTVERFKLACYALEDSVPWDRFAFEVVDVDGVAPGSPFDEHQRLGGYGESLWILSGRVFRSMGADWSMKKFGRFTDELLEAARDLH
ncbi:MAG: hypothetical protein R3F11_14330 [Verrucomicrobiales bacterium]